MLFYKQSFAKFTTDILLKFHDINKKDHIYSILVQENLF